MPGLGIKNILQATPAGYLAELEDGSQRVFTENDMVEAGYVGPTQGLYQDPAQSVGYAASMNPYEAPAAPQDVSLQNLEALRQQYQQQAAPVAPAAAPGPSSARAGYSANTSTPGYTDRRKVFGDAPASVNLDPQQQKLEQQRDTITGSIGLQERALGLKDAALTRADETVYGKYDPQTGELLQAGGAQMRTEQMEQDLDDRADFDAATRDYVLKRTNEINERIARVPQEDPGKIWGDNSAFQNAAGLMAATLGGMLAVSTGSGRNTGLEAIERAIDRNINAQRTNIENEWKKVAHDKDSLQQYQEWKGRERQHMLEESAVRLESLAVDIEARASTFKSQARQAEHLGMAASLRQLGAEKVTELLKLEADFAATEASGALQRWKALGDAAVQRSQIAENYAQANLAKASAKAKTADPNPPIYQFKNGDTLYLDPRYASTMRPEDIEKHRQTAAKKDTFLQSYDELIRDMNAMGRKLAVSPGKVGVGSPELKALKDRAMKFALDYTNEKAATTFTDRLLETVSSMSGTPQGLTDVDKIPSMLEFKKSALGEFDSQFRGRGAFVVGGKADESGQPSVTNFDAYNQYGADPRPGDPAPPGQRLKAAVTDVLYGTDPDSQIGSLDSILNYATANTGQGRAGIMAMLTGLTEVDVGGKKGLSSRGGLHTADEGEAAKRLTLQRARLKALAPERADRIDQMFDELEGYLKAEPPTPDPYGNIPRTPAGGMRR